MPSYQYVDQDGNDVGTHHLSDNAAVGDVVPHGEAFCRVVSVILPNLTDGTFDVILVVEPAEASTTA